MSAERAGQISVSSQRSVSHTKLIQILRVTGGLAALSFFTEMVCPVLARMKRRYCVVRAVGSRSTQLMPAAGVGRLFR